MSLFQEYSDFTFSASKVDVDRKDSPCDKSVISSQNELEVCLPLLICWLLL